MKQLFRLVVTLSLIVASFSSTVNLNAADQSEEDPGARTILRLISALTYKNDTPSVELDLADSYRSRRNKETESPKEKDRGTPTGVTGTLLSTAVGTWVSGANAIGQTINNLGGNTFIGSLGRSISKVAERFAGKVKFILFTTKNPIVGFELTKKTFDKSNFLKGKPVLVIIHGFTPAGYFENYYDNLVSSFKIKNGAIANNILSNVLMVDWTGLSSDGTYIFSSTATATTADRLSDFLIWLVKKGHVSSPKEIRITGHSLGGHTAGITGKMFNEKYGKKIARIDGPNFDISFSKFQLTQYDADYVHVIHCNIRFLGSHLNRGNSDFYPNGGDDLPGCAPELQVQPIKNETKAARKKRFLVAAIKTNVDSHICNHLRCIDLYIEVMDIKDEKLGCKCDSWEKFNNKTCLCDEQKNKPRMGYHCPVTASGTYYLNITMKPLKKENTTAFNNYGAGGAPLEEQKSIPKGFMLDSLNQAVVQEDVSKKKLNSEHATATTPSPSDPKEKAEIVTEKDEDEETTTRRPATTTPPTTTPPTTTTAAGSSWSLLGSLG